MGGEDHQHPRKAIDCRHLNAKDVLHKGGNGAAPSQQKNPAICANEGRGQHGDDDQDLHKPSSNNFDGVHQVGQKGPQDDGKHRGAQRYLQTVQQCVEVVALTEKLDKIGERKLSVAADDALPENLENGIEEEDGKQHQTDKSGGAPYILLYLILPHRSLLHAPCCAPRFRYKR